MAQSGPVPGLHAVRLISPGERYVRYADTAHGMSVEDWLFCGVGPGGFQMFMFLFLYRGKRQGLGNL
jgi:hypothetical protein